MGGRVLARVRVQMAAQLPRYSEEAAVTVSNGVCC